MRIQYVDEKTGKSVEQFQMFVYDNLPFYCNYCKHQGHNENEKRAGNKSLVVDKNGVHDQVVEAQNLECQTKEHSGQLLGRAIAHESASGDQSLTTRKTLVLESQVDFGQQLNSNIVDDARLGSIDTGEKSINNKSGKNGFLQIDSNIVHDVHSSGIKVGAAETLEKILNENQLCLTTNPTLVINATVELALDPMSAKVVADGVKHDALGVECLVDNMSQQVNNANKFFESDDGTNSIALMNAKSTGKGEKSPSIGIGSPIRNIVQPVVDSQTMNLGAREIVPKEVSCFNTFDGLTNNIVHEINSSQVNSTNELVISKEQQGATSTPRWGDITYEEEERVNPTPMQKKLSPTAPAFVPSGAKLVTPRQGLSSSTNDVAILSNHLVNIFANLDDEDIYEEGEEEEEEMLDYCFAIAVRNVDISPRHQRNNKTKHGRKHS
ncbi:hypothetical protein H5410_062122 [Solanum commersonii]|uniref:Uncharacterized protein n=1 Tax=Solanum commersonii TaxID=4109 RepID=A0A9J5WAQ1_SOLCO|nr:hypothetical protein H5410_062122 [Solanum commersonii]